MSQLPDKEEGRAVQIEDRSAGADTAQHTEDHYGADKVQDSVAAQYVNEGVIITPDENRRLKRIIYKR